MSKTKACDKSSTEAELVALSKCIIEEEKVEKLLMDNGKLMDKDLLTDVHKVYQDNISTIALVKNGGGQPCSKYIWLCQEYVKEKLDTGKLEIDYIRTAKMLADILTKPPGGELLHSIV